MGDMADMVIEDIIDDMVNENDWDYDYTDHIVFVHTPIKCRFCGRSTYHWAQLEDGSWRLHTPTGRLHKCSKWSPTKEVNPQTIK